MLVRQTDRLRAFVHHWLVRPPSAGLAVGWALFWTLAATLLRAALAPLLGVDFPFITYFLGVTLAAATGGFRAGVLALLLSVLLAWYFFLPVQQSFAFGDVGAAVGLAVFAFNAALLVVSAAMLRTLLWQLSVSEHRQALLARELNHRVKNNLAAVQALATHSARDASDLESFLQVFRDRIVALGRTHELLAHSDWGGVGLEEVIAAEAQPYGQERFRISGPAITLPPNPAVSLGMIVHELATNAVKYGALRQDGTVEVSWRASGGRGELSWRERGGPVVSPPKRRGLGTPLIERLALVDLDGDAAFDFRPEGLVATIRFALPADGAAN